MSSIDTDIALAGNGFWRAWRAPLQSTLPPPTFGQLAEFHYAESKRFALIADDETLTAYERGRAAYRASCALLQGDECARIAVAEALFA